MGDMVYQRDVLAPQLGMPVGTAASRLRNMIMFQLVQQTGRDTCYQCELKILSAGELSIEHKQPWRNADPALFWDLDNIAFSHRKCNRPSSYPALIPGVNGGKNKTINPPGMAWCARCKQYRPVTCFHKQTRRWNGLKNNCKDCECA